MYICETFVTNSSLNVNQLYSYYSDFYIERFKRIEIVFSSSKTMAIVINCFEIDNLLDYENKIGFKLSKVINVIDEEAIINEEQYNLAKWLSYTTLSPFIACLNTMLPKALRTSKKTTQNKKDILIKKNPCSLKLTTKQQDIYNQLNDGMLLSEARKLSVSIVNKLINLNLIEIYEQDSQYKDSGLLINNSFKELTSDQQKVYEEFLKTDKVVSLLFGVTGSGKTEVYLHLAKNYIEQGKEVLILVPEISLTPQMIERVKERFNDVIFYHSELNDQERYEQYERVKQGKIKIVVGTRSAVFLPFNNLGLIIIDEEHDVSYKQDNIPCYSAKSVAIKRALHFNAKVLLASATPSLESYSHALKGDYTLLELKERINKKLPEISIVDLTKEVKSKRTYILSNTLKNEITDVLSLNQQVIILLNRRGYSPIIKCGDCGTTIMCEDCDVPLNYHKDINMMVCHQCGRKYKVINRCPKCGSDNLIYYGYGTKRVEEELHNIFPMASIERMDRDNVSKKGAHEKILKRFENHEIDILVGTQMIAKGLDYPGVTLVGILNADAGLAHQDYNSAKITFDLLMQASGRSGRSNNQGKVIIQAFNPEHYALKATLNQDYRYFYNIEMNYRSKTKYPPYSQIIEIIISDSKIEKVNKSIKLLVDELDKANIKHYNPTELTRLKNEHRYHILVSSKDIKSLIDDTWNIVNKYLKTKGLAKIKIDIDPLYLE